MKPSTRRFYRIVIMVEVLSEEPYYPHSLRQIHYDTMNDCSGEWSITTREEVDGPTMAKLLLEQGSSSEFFQLDEQGNDLEDEE